MEVVRVQAGGGQGEGGGGQGLIDLRLGQPFAEEEGTQGTQGTAHWWWWW